jgi:hypothetical protein
MPLLGPREKDELEGMILERLSEYWNAHGPERLLAPGMTLALDATGPSIVGDGAGSALASVEIRTLFTALCHLSTDPAYSLPHDSLALLASEAAGSLAAQVNRLVPD